MLPGLVRNRVLNAYKRSLFGYEGADALRMTLEDTGAEKYGAHCSRSS